MGLAAFLPPHLAADLVRRRHLPKVPLTERFPAALLFSDVSGFTALTERLQGRGREGAEEVTAVVRRAFRPVLAAIEKWGGSVVSFGGDAVFVVFVGAGRAGRAFRCAEEVREAFARRSVVSTSAGPVTLGLSQALHHGTVLGLHLGSQKRRHYLACGPSVSALARIEARAESGEVLVSRAARAQLGQEGRIRTPRPWSLQGPPKLIRPYVPPHVLATHRRYKGAFRRAVMVFLETRGAPAGCSPAVRPPSLGSPRPLRRHPGGHRSLQGRRQVALRLRGAARPRGRSHPGGPSGAGGDPVGPSRLAGPGRNARRHRRQHLGGERPAAQLRADGRRHQHRRARTQAKAEWGSLFVTDTTGGALVGIETESRGRFQMKGKAQAMELHQVVRVSGAAKSLDLHSQLLGRDAEMARIRAGLAAARAGQGCAIGMRGGVGMGKSRLAWEAMNQARETGFRVHRGHSSALGGGPYATIRQVLRDALDLREDATADELAERVQRQCRDRLSPLDLRHLLDVLGVAPPDSPVFALSARVRKLNNMVAIRAAVQSLCEEAPRVVTFDDMQWADELSAEAAGWLAAAAPRTRLCLLLAYRPSYQPPLSVEELDLGALSRPAIKGIFESLVALQPADLRAAIRARRSSVLELLDRLGETGNPLFIEELVRHLAHTVPRAQRLQDLPDTIEALITARLDTLSPDALQILQLAAVQGRTFRRELTARLHPSASSIDEPIDELVQAGLLASGPGEGQLMFQQTLVRDVAYSGILLAHRTVLHRRTAQALERGELGETLATIGHHWEQAGRNPEARRCYLQAARDARAVFAQKEAERLYQRYLELAHRNSSERVKAKAELGADVLAVGGKSLEALELITQAVREAEILRDPSLQASCLRRAAHVHRRRGDMATSQTLYHRAKALYESFSDRASLAHSHADLAVHHMEMGQVEDARRNFDLALKLHREFEQARGEAIVLANQATLMHRLGRIARARTLFQRTIRLFRKVGDRQGEANATGNLAVLLMELGDWEEARQVLERALQMQRRIGNRRMLAVVLGNLGTLHRLAGRPEEAAELLLQAIEIQRTVGDRQGEGSSLGNLGSVREDEGKVNEAQALTTSALELARQLGDTRSEGAWLCNLANLALEQGDVRTARRHAEASLARLRQVGDRRNEGCALLELARIERYEGNLSSVEELLTSAGELLTETGEKMELLRCLCEQGHLRLARGESARADLAAARRLARSSGLTKSSPYHRFIDRLAEAEAARRSAGRQARSR